MNKTPKIVAVVLAAAFAILATGMAPADATAPGSLAKTSVSSTGHHTSDTGWGHKAGDTGWG